jgi:hypothetical protein
MSHPLWSFSSHAVFDILKQNRQIRIALAKGLKGSRGVAVRNQSDSTVIMISLSFLPQTVEEHMQLSFSHIMKHWKRNPNQPGVTKIPGSSRNVLLRFYPPQSALGKSQPLYKSDIIIIIIIIICFRLLVFQIHFFPATLSYFTFVFASPTAVIRHASFGLVTIHFPTAFINNKFTTT